MTPPNDGNAVAYNGIGAEHRHQLARRQLSEIHTRIRHDQTTSSGNVDFWLRSTRSSPFAAALLRQLQGYGRLDDDVRQLSGTSSIGVPGVPANLQLPISRRTRDACPDHDFDTTKSRFFQLDYNHSFNAGGAHSLKGGVGVRHSTNDVNSVYPGGYVSIDWGRT